MAGASLLRLERLPVSELEEDFKRFVEDLAPACTPVLAPVARRLALDPALGIEAARAFAAGDPLDGLADLADCDVIALAFFPLTFLQPIAERLAVLAVDAAPSWPSDSAPPADTAPLCPSCGHPPVVGSLADEPDHQGRRRLVCSLCGTAWPFPRLTCAGCLETGAERLAHHVSEAWPHVRVDECTTCGRYQKTVDLRAAGDAVPLVDELASIELDLWADERGLEKLQRNLMGL